ncbi:MAG: hypothetical protein JOY93_12770, partial [Acidobacteriales bacterium]|nr:hypothetical protein [Terriglobales bacterium]
MIHQALLFCPDEKTALAVTQVLTELEFRVEACAEPFSAVKKLMTQRFDAIVLDCDDEQNATLFLKSARSSVLNQTALAVAVVEGQAGVAKAFRIGANLVLTKPINIEQSKGTLRVARGLLRKTDAPAASPVPPPVTPVTPASSTTQFVASTTQTSPLSNATGRPPLASARAMQGPSIPDSNAPRLDSNTKASPTNSYSSASGGGQQSANAPAKAASFERPQFAAGQAAQEHPRQPVAKTSLDSIVSSGNRPETAEKAAGVVVSASTPSSKPAKTSAPAPASPGHLREQWPGARVELPRPDRSSVPSNRGAAAAAAPAKENPKPHDEVAGRNPQLDSSDSQQFASYPEAIRAKFATSNAAAETSEPDLPVFSGYADSSIDPATPAREGGSKIWAVPVAVIALAMAGYFGWSKLHRGSSQEVTSQKAASVSQPTQVEVQPSLASQPEGTVPGNTNSQLSNAVPAASHPVGASQKPSVSGKSEIDSSSPVNDVTTRTVKAPAAMASKSSETSAASGAATVEEPAAPTLAQALPPAADRTIAGIIAVPAAVIPKRQAPQTLNVSQGISAGLLVKNVPPV